VDLGWTRVAYVEQGNGSPVFLLHGCPFQGFEWTKVVPHLSKKCRVIVPDLLGLGDTIVSLKDDYRLPQQVKMIIALLDHFGLEQAHIVGHDHGGAIAQLLIDRYPDRILSVTLTNVEAYDQWPSDKERGDVRVVVNFFTSPLFRLAISFNFIQKWIYRIAVVDVNMLTDELLHAFVRPHIASPRRWARLRRFFRWQLDRNHNLETARAVEGLRTFTKPTLLLWGGKDLNFGLKIARQLQKDIPGVVELKILEASAHLPMLEEPENYSASLLEFISTVDAERK